MQRRTHVNDETSLMFLHTFHAEIAGSTRDLGSLVTIADLAAFRGRDFKDKKQWFHEKCEALKMDTDTHGHIQINVRREHILQDSVNAVMSIHSKNIPLLWNVGFCGEMAHGVDGSATEWFELVRKELQDSSKGMWQPCTNNRNAGLRINPLSGNVLQQQDGKYFRFTGRMIGRALLDGRGFPFHMAPYVFKFITGDYITLLDLKQTNEPLYRRLELLDDIEDIKSLDLNFTIEDFIPFEGMQSTEIIPGGANIEVTDQNLGTYKRALVKFVLFDRVKHQLLCLLQGIFEVVPSALLSVFEPTELEVLLCGCLGPSHIVEFDHIVQSMTNANYFAKSA